MAPPSGPTTIRSPPGGEGCSAARDEPPAFYESIGTREARLAYYRHQVEDLGDGRTAVHYRRIIGPFTRVCGFNASEVRMPTRDWSGAPEGEYARNFFIRRESSSLHVVRVDKHAPLRKSDP